MTIVEGVEVDRLQFDRHVITLDKDFDPMVP